MARRLKDASFIMPSPRPPDHFPVAPTNRLSPASWTYLPVARVSVPTSGIGSLATPSATPGTGIHRNPATGCSGVF